VRGLILFFCLQNRGQIDFSQKTLKKNQSPRHHTEKFNLSPVAKSRS
jgi:hypothetical protein